MATGNGELVHKFYQIHLRMETAKMKQDKDTEEEVRKGRMNVERAVWAAADAVSSSIAGCVVSEDEGHLSLRTRKLLL